MEGEGQRKKIVCTVCHLMYDRYKHEPLVISPCSHTFCRECITSLELKACRICNSEIKTKNTNWALLDILPLSEYELKKQKVEAKAEEAETLRKSSLNNRSLQFNKHTDKIKDFRDEIDRRAAELHNLLFSNQHALIHELNGIEEKLNKDRFEIESEEEALETNYNDFKAKLNSNSNHEMTQEELDSLYEQFITRQAELNAKAAGKQSWDDFDYIPNAQVPLEVNLIGIIVNTNQTNNP